MLWDESFVSWDTIGIRSQPSAIMVSPTGEPLSGWFGAFPQDEVLELAAPYGGA